jgi:hypothetical protein
MDPQALGGYDVEALFNICKALGLDWVTALPTLSGRHYVIGQTSRAPT